VRVVADSHAIVWYIAGSRRLSDTAASVLREAEATDGIVVSVASLIDLWYVTQTTEAVTAADLGALRTTLDGSAHVTLQEIGLAVVDSAATIPRDSLADPWDRLSGTPRPATPAKAAPSTPPSSSSTDPLTPPASTPP
jgi:PIN domain nuclease of toxin-antitoxin system